MGLRFLKTTFVLSMMFVLAAPPDATAIVTLYATNVPNPGGPSNLYSVNISTGMATLIGPIGFDRVGAMAAENGSTEIFATGQRASDSLSVLIRINPATGVGTAIGATGFPGNSSRERGSVSDISFRLTDGALYAYHAQADPEHKLFTINTSSGAATLVGLTGLSFVSGNALAFAGNDVLFHADDNALHTFNTTTGASTLVTFLDYSLLSGATPPAMAFHPTSGDLYAVMKASGGPQLARIIPSTGSVQPIGPMEVNKMDGMVFLTTGTVDVPNPQINSGLQLTGGWPNPFSTGTTIRFNLSLAGNARLAVYNVRGRKIRELLDEHRAAGSASIHWNGRDDHGALQPSGRYILRLEVDGNVRTTSMTLVH